MKIAMKPKSKKLKALNEKKKTSKTKAKFGKSEKSKPDVGEMSVDQFLSGGFESEDEGHQKNATTKKQKSSHKEDLKKLQTVDPEFYKFLKENDEELLNFDESDLDSDDEIKNETVHQPPERLDVASDESDFEPLEDEEDTLPRGDLSSGGCQNVTLKMINKWQEDLQKDKTSKTLGEVIEAFQAALATVTHSDEQSLFKYRVEGSAVFNAVVRLLVVELQPALRKILKLPSKSKQPPHKCKAWVKVKHLLVKYFKALAQLCQVTSPGMLQVLLKHLHQMIPFLSQFPSESNRFVNRLVQLWTSDADVVRVLAFLCLLRLANHRKELLGLMLKKMYLTFVRNSKFVSPSSLAGLHFLRQSLSEMFALDPALSYQHAFLYIRQLSIHLRNAVTLNKKESTQSVYNWQFTQSLLLWSDLMGLVPSGTPLSSLIYPLVQITIGAIKLVPSAQYFPLRFQCIRVLLNVSERCGVFVPILPFLLEVLKDFDWNRKHKKTSLKPMDLRCILRCSKAQMQESGFKDSVLENTCSLLLEAFNVECYRVSFPDIVVPSVLQMKAFLKTCKVSNYCKKIKVLLDKVLENSKTVETERAKMGNGLKLNDPKSIRMFEMKLQAMGSLPLQTYFTQWKKLHTLQMNKRYSNNEQIGDYKLPTLYKFDKKRSKEKEVENSNPPELFPSDDDEEELAIEKEEIEPPKKKKKKNNKKEEEEIPEKLHLPENFVVEGEDIIEDLNVSDLDE